MMFRIVAPGVHKTQAAVGSGVIYGALYLLWDYPPVSLPLVRFFLFFTSKSFSYYLAFHGCLQDTDGDELLPHFTAGETEAQWVW